MTMTEEDICKEYREAKDRKAQVGILAELNGCSKEKIAEVLESAGIQAEGVNRKKKLPEDRMLELYDRGLSDEAIAREIGCSGPTVSKWRREKGLKTMKEKLRDMQVEEHSGGETVPEGLRRAEAVLDMLQKDDGDRVREAIRTLASELASQEILRRVEMLEVACV